VKQSLFDGVMGEGEQSNFVDFSSKGRSQFIQQLEEFLAIEHVSGDPEDGVVLSARDLSDPENFVDDADFEDSEWFETAVEGIAETAGAIEPPDVVPVLSEEPEKDGISAQPGLESHHTTAPSAGALSDVETVMNSGMQFLAGMFKMATGKEISMADKAIEVDKTTGEVVMRFRIPV